MAAAPAASQPATGATRNLVSAKRRDKAAIGFSLNLNAAPPPPPAGFHLCLPPSEAECLRPLIAPLTPEAAALPTNSVEPRYPHRTAAAIEAAGPPGKHMVSTASGTFVFRCTERRRASSPGPDGQQPPPFVVTFESSNDLTLSWGKAPANSFESGSQASIASASGGRHGGAIDKKYCLNNGECSGVWNELSVCSKECMLEEKLAERVPGMGRNHILTFIGSWYVPRDARTGLPCIVVQTKCEGDHLATLAEHLKQRLLEDEEALQSPNTSLDRPPSGGSGRVSRGNSQPPEGAAQLSPARSLPATPNRSTPLPHALDASLVQALQHGPQDYGGYCWDAFHAYLVCVGVQDKTYDAMLWQPPAGASNTKADSATSHSQRQQQFSPGSTGSSRLTGTASQPEHATFRRVSSFEFDSAASSTRYPQPPFPERLVALIARDVLSGLQYLALQHFRVHGDIKPENVVLGKNDRHHLVFKLCDFGSASKFTLPPAGADVESGIVHSTHRDAFHHIPATANYKAPERYSDLANARNNTIQYGPPADVYALGAMMVVLFTGKPPTSFDPTPSAPYAPPAIPSDLKVSDEMRMLVASMVVKDPSARPKLSVLIDKIEATWGLKDPITRVHVVTAFLAGIDRTSPTPESQNAVADALSVMPRNSSNSSSREVLVEDVPRKRWQSLTPTNSSRNRPEHGQQTATRGQVKR